MRSATVAVIKSFNENFEVKTYWIISYRLGTDSGGGVSAASMINQYK